MFKFFLIICFLFWSASTVFGQTYQNKANDFYIDILPDWQIVTSDDNMFEAVSADKKLAIMIGVENNKQSKLEQEKLYTNYFTDYKPIAVESEGFIYNGYNARMGFGDFSSENGKNYRAYVLLVQKDNKNFWVTAMGLLSDTETYLAEIFSTIDSFSINKDALLTSGSISQLDFQKSANLSETEISFNGKKYKYMFDAEEFNVSQRVVEREMSIMKEYAKVANETAYLAWVRYYRMIYRDNFARFTSLYNTIKGNISSDKTTSAQELLTYTQEYDYVRNLTESDLNAPYSATITKQGDCDSMSLAYIILLNHHKINSALLLSQSIEHAIVVVDVPKPDENANGIELFEKNYVIAELTTKDKLGIAVDRVLATTDWFPILFEGLN